MEDKKYGLGENPPYSLYSVESEGQTLWGLVDKDGRRLDAVFHRTDDDRFYCVPNEVLAFDAEEGFSLLAWYDPAVASDLAIQRQSRVAMIPTEYKDISELSLEISADQGMRLLAELYVKTINANERDARFLLGAIIDGWMDHFRDSKYTPTNAPESYCAVSC